MKKNKQMLRKIVSILCVGMLIMGMSGCSSDSSNDEESSQKTEYTQDETVTYEDVNYTVTNVKKSAGTEYDTPKDGYEYVVITIKIENNSDEKISYNEYDWKMENSNGQELDCTYSIDDSDTALDSGDLKSGGNVEGSIVFEEPKDDDGLQLNYYSNYLFDEEPSFTINID